MSSFSLTQAAKRTIFALPPFLPLDLQIDPVLHKQNEQVAIVKTGMEAGAKAKWVY
jgi:hypothetical protein